MNHWQDKASEVPGGNPLHVRRRHGRGGVEGFFFFHIQILSSPIKAAKSVQEVEGRKTDGG
ncbi:ABC transporter G family member 2, partial [Clarias magur]